MSACPNKRSRLKANEATLSERVQFSNPLLIGHHLDKVAEVDPDREPHLAMFRKFSLSFPERLLDPDPTADGVPLVYLARKMDLP